MVLDVRAQVVCNLGPVISGSVKDDHVQGQGLVFTTGELTIAGLITPAHGTIVNLAYVGPDGERLVRFPRGPFRITQAFANPLSNQTEIRLANELAYQKGKGGGTLRSALVEALNGRVPKAASVMDLREAFGVMANRVGISVGELGSWSLPKQLEALESPDYIETMGDILASVGRVGYLDATNTLQTVAYGSLSNAGPLLGFDQLIDLNPNAGGVDFSETPTGSGNAQQVDGPADTTQAVVYTRGVRVEEGTYGRFSASWDNTGLSTSTLLRVTYYNQSQDVFTVTEDVITSEKKAEPDNRVIQRNTETRNNLVKLNSQIVQDRINFGKKIIEAYQNGRASKEDASAALQYIDETFSLAMTTISTSKTDLYEYEEIPPPPLSAKEQEQIDQEIESIKQQQSSAGEHFSSPNSGQAQIITLLPKLPTYRKIFEQTKEEMSYVEAMGRIGIKDYNKFSTYPTGKGTKEVTEITYLYGDRVQKELKRIYVAYGLTQMGQQALAAAAQRLRSGSLLSFQPLLDQFFTLVLEDHVITIRDVEDPNQKKPIPDYLAAHAASDFVIQGGNRIQIGEQPEERPNKRVSFEVPFLPDDVINDDGTVTKGNGEAAAAGYAEQQNRLLLGHRLGLQVTTALNRLPTAPLGAFHLTSNGLTATYRTNGLAIAFDANSCMVSVDALYWGMAGGDVNGPRWTPVAPGTAALPTPPSPVDNGPQLPANSIALDDPVDVSDQASIDALLAALPDDEAEVFETELTPEALALPFKPITETVVTVRLQSEALLVPLGINRAMGDTSGEVRVEQRVRQAINAVVKLQLESSERRSLVETLSAGLALEATLS